ncbi:MAG: hypothetical protein GX434_13925 [Peptococcaceae bacterium]|nr:hypothetical protein [Peptococcaceae bacterium]
MELAVSLSDYKPVSTFSGCFFNRFLMLSVATNPLEVRKYKNLGYECFLLNDDKLTKDWLA